MAFALNPAAALQGVINYGEAESKKHYKYATRYLGKEEDAFDCEPANLHSFLKLVTQRSEEYGWDNDILLITCADGVQRNLLNEYGAITIEEIRDEEITYIDQEVRQAQDTYMLYKCLIGSLSKIGRDKVTLYESDYKVGDYYSGCLLLKIIIRESHLDTNATTSQIRTKLGQLDEYIVTIGSDISKFNQYVSLLVEALTARNERTTDLLEHLFKGYLAASDKTFVHYIARKQVSDDDSDSVSVLTDIE